MMGGRGAFAHAMQYPDLFSVLYAMNPVGTGTGVLPIQTYPNWKKMHEAKSFSDLDGEPISQLFLTMSQAFLPNPNRPPFYCDFLMEMENGELVFNADNAQNSWPGFRSNVSSKEMQGTLKKCVALRLIGQGTTRFRIMFMEVKRFHANWRPLELTMKPKSIEVSIGQKLERKRKVLFKSASVSQSLPGV